MSRHIIPTRRRGFTLVELLVVMAIIGILMGLLLPAVNAAREVARRLQCSNNMSQSGKGIQTLVSRVGHYPTGGFGCLYLGDPGAGYGWRQPAGWQYSVLPFVDQQAVFDMPVKGGKGTVTSSEKKGLTTRMCQVPIPVYNCPTRRKCDIYPGAAKDYYYIYEGKNHSAGHIIGDNSADNDKSFRGDFALNGGVNFETWDHNDYAGMISNTNSAGWFTSNKTGIATAISQIKPDDVTDGLSNTMLLGEKFMPANRYTDGQFDADNEPALSGDSRDQIRWGNSGLMPRQDRIGYSGYVFGGAHADSFNLIMCDGSLKRLSYAVTPAIYECIINRADGKAMNMIDFLN